MIISKREEERFKKLKVAMEKWVVISPDPSHPSTNVLGYLAGLSNVVKFEVNNILKGGI
jgi:hypothetical protein